MKKALKDMKCKDCGLPIIDEQTEHCKANQNTPTNTLREQICSIFNVFPDELGYDLPGGIGLKKVEQLEALISQAVNKALDKLHYDIMDGHYRPPEGTTDPAFYYAQFHRIIDDNKVEADKGATHE